MRLRQKSDPGLKRSQRKQELLCQRIAVKNWEDNNDIMPRTHILKTVNFDINPKRTSLTKKKEIII